MNENLAIAILQVITKGESFGFHTVLAALQQTDEYFDLLPEDFLPTWNKLKETECLLRHPDQAHSREGVILNPKKECLPIFIKRNQERNKKHNMKNYKYEILKLLMQHKGKIDVDLLMDTLTVDVPDSEKFESKGKIAGTITGMQEPETPFVKKWLITTGSTFSNRYHNMSNRRNDDDELIELEVTPEGIEEFHRLDKIFNPPPPIIPQQIIHYETHGTHSPIAGHDMTIKANEESAETKELVKEQLKDIRPNKWFRKWGFIVAIFLLIIGLVSLLLMKAGKT